MAAVLEDHRIAFLATDGVEDVELTQSWDAIENAGGTPVLVSISSGTIKSYDHDVESR